VTVGRYRCFAIFDAYANVIGANVIGANVTSPERGSALKKNYLDVVTTSKR